MADYRINQIELKNAAGLFKIIEENKDLLKLYFPNTIKENQSIEDTKIYIETNLSGIKTRAIFPFGIFENDKLIGIINIKNIDWDAVKCELGYFIDKESYGKGITSKIVRQVLEYAFYELKMNKVFLRIGPENKASQRIAEKNGFTKEGVLRQEFKIGGGEVIDVWYYGLLSKEFK